MRSRETIIAALKAHAVLNCADCPLRVGWTTCKISTQTNLLLDAATMIENVPTTQEPKPPVVTENSYGWRFFHCPSCGREFVAPMNYCSKCGQAVKWDC